MMKRVAELEGAELDYWAARQMGGAGLSMRQADANLRRLSAEIGRAQQAEALATAMRAVAASRYGATIADDA